MQFKVPQFIDIEDKVFGPLTFKQFAYLAGGAGFGYLSFHFLPLIIAIFLGPAIVAFALALAFMKYNEKPFIQVVESFIKYYSHSRLYLWRKQPASTAPNNKLPAGIVSPILMADPKDPQVGGNRNRATMPESNLQTLSWSLDVIGSKK
jgi:hypothetical protein